jgi:hypothetical protein
VKSAAIVPALAPVGLMAALLCNGVSPAWSATCACVVWFVAVLAILVMADREDRP